MGCSLLLKHEATVTKAQPDIGLDRFMRGTRAFKNPPTRAWPITKGRTIQNIGLEKPINCLGKKIRESSI